MVAWPNGISLLVLNSIHHSFAALTREILKKTLEEKFNIFAPMYYSLFSVLKGTGAFPLHQNNEILKTICTHHDMSS